MASEFKPTTELNRTVICSHTDRVGRHEQSRSDRPDTECYQGLKSPGAYQWAKLEKQQL